MQKKIDSLEEKVLYLELELARVVVKANENEQYSRHHNVRVLGLDENKDEDYIDKIVEFCNKKLNVEIAIGQLYELIEWGSQMEISPNHQSSE